MAEQVLEKLGEELNCSICLDTYTDPKLLQCFHVFCQQCLVSLGSRDQQTLTCPTCRKVTPIPNKGVAALQSAFHINHLLDIYQDSVQKLQNPAATPERAVVYCPPKKVLQCCFDHAEEELKLYCETCGELICLQCVIKCGKHHDHDYVFIQQAFQQYSKEITSSLEPMENQVVIVKKAVRQFNTLKADISHQQTAIEDDIHVTFRKLRKVLDDRETKLIGKLHQMSQMKLKDLASQSDHVETTLAQLYSCLLFMKESLRPGNENDALMMKINTIEQVKELLTPILPDMLRPDTEADLVFLYSSDMTTKCQNFGEMLAPGLPDPSNCHITPESADNISATLVGKKCSVVLQAVNFEGKPCKECLKSLECELALKTAGTRAACGIERRGQSQYEISYQPTMRGRHQLHVTIDSQHIKKSPFGVAVMPVIGEVPAPLMTMRGVAEAWGVAISHSGEIVVTERGRHCVSVFTPDGEQVRSFGTYGSDEGQFREPRGIAVDHEGNVLVADWKNHRIHKFTVVGQFLVSVGNKGTGRLEFNRPSDIATSNNVVYVVDWGNHRIQILNSDFTFLSTFGEEGSGEGQFNYPCSVACDGTGRVYVADRDNHRIQTFTSDGNFLRMFGSRGVNIGELDSPISIAVDTSGVVYVGEGSNGRISVFNLNGQFLTTFGGKGKGPGEFDWPCGLVVDVNGVLYVCDYLNNNVQVF